MLQALGLDDSSESVYKALLGGPGTGIGGLRERTGLPENQIRAALGNLTALNLVHASSDSSGRWEAADPELGLGWIIRRQEAELARQQHNIAAAKAAAAAAAVTYALAYPGAARLERLAGAGLVLARADTLARSTQTELQVTISAAYAAGGWQPGSLLGRGGLAAGIKLSLLHHDSARDDPAALVQMTRLEGLGAHVRTGPYLPPLLMISDQRAALIPLDIAHPGAGAVFIREVAIAAALAAVFADIWGKATPWARAAGPADVTTGERVLLRLLAEGLTDEAAARRLGVSLRTIRRQTAALMDKLGASSRFQAGYKAAQRGWLQPAPPPQPRQAAGTHVMSHGLARPAPGAAGVPWPLGTVSRTPLPRSAGTGQVTPSSVLATSHRSPSRPANTTCACPGPVTRGTGADAKSPPRSATPTTSPAASR